jgi:hypothetical protein
MRQQILTTRKGVGATRHESQHGAKLVHSTLLRPLSHLLRCDRRACPAATLAARVLHSVHVYIAMADVFQTD